MYTLRLGSLQLAPRRSIKIVEAADFEKLTSNDTKCGSCSLVESREFSFRISLLNGSWDKFKQELAVGCGGSTTLYRKVRDEIALRYRVTSSKIKIIDVQNQYLCPSIYTIDLILGLANLDDGIKPLNVYVSVMQPTVSLAYLINVSPKTIAVSLVTPVP